MATTTTFISGNPIDAELHTPSAGGPHSLVVVAYGTDGYTDHLTGPWRKMIRGYAEDLARAGIAAMVPDYFASTRTTPGEQAMLETLNRRPAWEAALVAAVAHAKTLPSVDGRRIGLLGFSLGGHLCLRVRAAVAPKALVSFFAPVYDDLGPAGRVPHAELHHGKADQLPVTKFVFAEQIKRTLEGEGTTTTLFPYDRAVHGFIGEDTDNKNARTLSKSRVLTFFGAQLAP
jgi:dienelactone hydrolase